MEQSIVLNNESGLHARPAGLFVKEAGKFQSEVNIEAKGQTVNGKSIMSLLTLGLDKGDTVKIITNGADEELALTALVTFLENKLH